MRVRGMIAFAVALPIFPRYIGQAQIAGTGELVSAVVWQIFAGLALGFVVHVLFAAVQAAGNLIDLFSMFAMASILDPMSNTQSAVFGRIYSLIATTLLFSMDMQSTYTLQSNTEITFARLICMDLFERGYNIRAHSYGTGTDSLCLDAQNFIERTSLIHAMAMSNASVLGGMGQLETAKTISPVQLIIDNEIMGIAQRLRAGLDVNDETIDWDELIEGIDKDPAFSFLMSEHTFRHFEEPHRPDMFNRDGVVRWEREGSKTLLDKAEEKYYALMAEEADYALPADKAAAVDEVLKKAHAALVKD